MSIICVFAFATEWGGEGGRRQGNIIDVAEGETFFHLPLT